MAETKLINVSLMALKDCIRARSIASNPGTSGVPHIPYRRSKLTLLMKDVFGKKSLISVIYYCYE